MTFTVKATLLGLGIAVVPLALTAQRGGFGPPMQQERKLLKQFDRNGDKRLDAAERKARAGIVFSKYARLSSANFFSVSRLWSNASFV